MKNAKSSLRLGNIGRKEISNRPSMLLSSRDLIVSKQRKLSVQIKTVIAHSLSLRNCLQMKQNCFVPTNYSIEGK